MRLFKVLNSATIGWRRNFDGQVLEFISDSMVPGCVVLKQPEFDTSGVACSGVVTFDKQNVEEVPDECF